MPLVRTTKRHEPTPEALAAEAELAIMRAEIEAHDRELRRELRELVALDEHTPEQAARFDLLVKRRHERKREQKRDAIEGPLREAAAAAYWDKRAERGEPGFDDPIQRELFVMLGRRDFPLDKAERKAQNKARREAEAARVAAQAAERADLDARWARMKAGDEPDVAKPAERRAAPAETVGPPTARPARRLPRVEYLHF